MEKIVAESDDRITIYDTEKKTYKKSVKANYKKRFRMFLGLKRCHGENAYYLSNLLKKNGINTYEVISYDKFSYVTKEIEGTSLFSRIIREKNNEEKTKYYLKEYMKIIRKILDLNLYYTDFHLGNFIIDKDDKIYIIDIDEMQDSWYYGVLKKFRVIKKLKRTLKNDEFELKKYNIDFDADEMFYKYIKKRES